MSDSRKGLQEWVSENAESGKLFKRGKRKELDSIADFEIETPYGLKHMQGRYSHHGYLSHPH